MSRHDEAAEGFVVRNETGEEVALAMQELWLGGQVCAAGARLVVRHVFASAETAPVEAVYAFALPRDAALRRFRVEGPGFSAESDLRPAAEAEGAYEDGLEQGHLGVLARMYRDGIVNLSVGNLLPGQRVVVHLEMLAGVELRDGGFRFRCPFTIAPGYHAEARTIESVPGVGEIELPESRFGDVLLPPIHRDASGLHRVGFDLRVLGDGVTEVGSPSHAVRVRSEEGGGHGVALAPERDVPNRDLVLDVTFRPVRPVVLAAEDGAGRAQFAAIVPSSHFGASRRAPARVVFLLDRSGSMDGAPLDQARAAVRAGLAGLGKGDEFGLVVFDDRAEVFGAGMFPAAADDRRRAVEFLDGVHARGGTELLAGIRAAAALLAGRPGDVLVVTDGQVMGTEDIVGAARSLGARVHALGIGSASQDRFLSQIARQTGGLSRFVTPRERVDVAALDLFTAVASPLAEGLRVEARDLPEACLEPEPPSRLFAGQPVLLFGHARGGRAGRLHFEWSGGPDGGIDLPVAPAPDPDLAETLRLLRGARLIADVEAVLGETAPGPVGRRAARRTAKRLEELSRTYGLASREMSLVAVVQRTGDRPGAPPHTVVVPVGMAQDTSAHAYFGAGIVARYRKAAMACSAPPHPVSCCMDLGFGDVYSPRSPTRVAEAGPESGTGDPETPELMELVADLEPDGGMPAVNEEERFANSLVALKRLTDYGARTCSMAFLLHADRLRAFLTGWLDGLIASIDRELAELDQQLERLKTGRKRMERRRQELLEQRRQTVERLDLLPPEQGRPEPQRT